MSEAKHTPGPWALSTFRGSMGRTITTEAHLHRPFGCSATVCKDTFQATIATIGEHVHHFNGAECLANARLIAAAPDLLAACEVAAEELHGYEDAGQSNKDGHIVEMLRAAIARAKGKQ